MHPQHDADVFRNAQDSASTASCANEPGTLTVKQGTPPGSRPSRCPESRSRRPCRQSTFVSVSASPTVVAVLPSATPSIAAVERRDPAPFGRITVP